MRYLALVLLLLAYALAALSVGLNVSFGLAITDGPQRYLYAVAGGIVDVVKLLIPAYFVWAYYQNIHSTWRSYVPALAVWTVATVYSIAAAAGLFAVLRDNKVANVKLLHQQHRTAEHAGDRMRRELEDIDRRLSTMRSNYLFSRRRSNACTQATARSSRAFCRDYRRLEADRKDTDRRLRAFEKQVASSLDDVHRSIDPASRIWSSWFNVGEEAVRALVAIVLGSLLEFTAALIPSIVAPALLRYRKQSTQKSEPEPDTKNLPAPDKAPVDDVEAFALAAVVHSKGNAIKASDLYSHYERWTKSKGRVPVSHRAFGMRLAALGFEKVKSGNVKYTNLRIRDGA